MGVILQLEMAQLWRGDIGLSILDELAIACPHSARPSHTCLLMMSCC